MTMAIARRMAHLGGVAHISELLDAGFTRTQVAAMKNQGELLRPRIGWYVSPDSSEELIRAVRVGGMLGCTSALRTCGLPVPTGTDLHVAVEPGASRLRSSRDSTQHPAAGTERGVRLHWRAPEVAHQRFRVGLVDALLQASTCVSFEWAVAALDGARCSTRVGGPLLSESSLQLLQRLGGPGTRAVVDASTALSESPLETIARIRLRDHVDEIRQQVVIGPYRVDLLIDDWLVIECDGGVHGEKDRFRRDRERDAYFVAGGYLVLRFGYDQIIHRWDEVVLPAILAALTHAQRPRRHASAR